MTAQPMTLFDTGAHRTTDRATSVQAARSQRGGVYQALAELFVTGWSGTKDDAARFMPQFHPPTITSAISRLVRDGLVCDSGCTRPSDRGQESTVWVGE